ncbi:DUF397 domain-containing protein [Sciscionella marina]|uniref:DUF397 domain-containing protein n=1 Tax=Sciscionella marina TaxID=508770 RepID=UPI0003676F31|nr:DUF397 domain-containing protein [Sciscionella marina]
MRIKLGHGWSKSARSGNQGGNCVAVKPDGDNVLINHSADLDAAPKRFTREEMAAFVAGVKAGEFDDLA